MKKPIYIILFLFTSCTQESIELIELKSKNSTFTENSDVILAGVTSLDFAEGEFLVTEYDYNRFYFLSPDFNEIRAPEIDLNLVSATYPNFGKFGG